LRSQRRAIVPKCRNKTVERVSDPIVRPFVTAGEFGSECLEETSRSLRSNPQELRFALLRFANGERKPPVKLGWHPPAGQ
jgi:hypothetical protein